MDYIKIRFGDNFFTVDADIQKGITDIFRTANPSFAKAQHLWRPRMDIYETQDEFIIMIEIAGIQQEDLHLEVSSRSLKIYGKRYENLLCKGAKYRLAEMSYGYFEREVALPVPIDTQAVAATYVDGLLQIKLTKQPLDRAKKITIKST